MVEIFKKKKGVFKAAGARHGGTSNYRLEQDKIQARAQDNNLCI
jgi:hypothetical protein